MVSTYDHIPENLLLKIFLPQPAKFLLQLRCVCKSWDQFIRSNFFIKSHLAHQKASSNTITHLLLDYGTSYSTCLIDSESDNNHMYNVHDDVCGRDLANDGLKTYGICDGVLCLSNDKNLYAESHIFLWNPIVRKGKKLPPIGTDIWYNGHSYMCFGYHDGDYKVIKVVPCLLQYDIFIYSLSTNSWKLSEFHMNIDESRAYAGDTFDIYPKARLVNGIAYFMVKFTSRIVSFDLCSKRIRQINLPNDFSFGGNFIMEEYGKSIALFGYNRRVMEMWVLRVNGNSFSWDKKFATEEFKYNFQPMGFVNNDKLVIRLFTGDYILYSIKNDFRLVFRTPKEQSEKGKKQVRPLRINGFAESLVLLAQTTANATSRKHGGRNS